jgi:3'-5' exoribonuclease
MSQTQRNKTIREWSEGDYVQGFALLARKERRTDRNGRDYLDLQLADSTGNISGKIWAGSPAMDGDFDAHDFVAFKGAVRSYRDQLQLNVDQCRRVQDSDREYGFDESTLIPSTREDIDDLQSRLERVLKESLKRPEMRQLALESLRAYGEALREHPAAKTMHHAYRGGLLEHTTSMAELALKICQHYPDLDRDLILVGALFHDLGKLQELGAMPANDYTPVGRLVGHVVLGRDLLRERCAAIADFPADLQLHLEHLILSHQGRKEFGSPVEPMTAEAVALHFIDDLDSKLNQLTIARDEGEPVQFLRGMGRYMYLGDLADELAGGPPEAGEARKTESEEGSEAAEVPVSD